MHITPGPESSALALIVAIILSGFLSEDGAAITAATLAMSSLLDIRLAFAGAFAGLWVGDLGVYFLARGVGTGLENHRLFHNWARSARRRAMPDITVNRRWKLALSRFFPGTRLPAYVAAGLGRMPVVAFAAITATSAAIWTFLVFAALHLAPSHAHSAKGHLAALSFFGLSLFAILTAWRVWGRSIRSRVGIFAKKLVRWEFWPGWLFYTPVVMFCAWLGIRHRGLSLPTIANLNQRNGGIVGESKVEILRELMETSPEFTADGYLVESGPAYARRRRVSEILGRHAIATPFVLKPDTAQRGAGFKKIRSIEDADEFVAQVSAPLLLQRYVAGPNEAGIFYYRFPHEAEGRIFGITRKQFPVVVGDGRRSLEELIEFDPRARLIANVYLNRFGDAASRIPPYGERVRLVEAGNHCQGCIFEDGYDLYSEQLRRRIDEISRKIPGFYVGRFDIRYRSDDGLRAGAGFQIVELNGAASEATNIYDARNSVWRAYTTLYRQWQIVYAIGEANRRHGAAPASALNLWRDWKAFSAQACEFPVAD